jgi:hypothetical protein
MPMPVTQLANVIVPVEFSNYIVENSLGSTALFQSGVAVKNDLMAAQLSAGATSFTVPCWSDAADVEANISDDSATLSTAQKLNQPWCIGPRPIPCRFPFVPPRLEELALTQNLKRPYRNLIAGHWYL